MFTMGKNRYREVYAHAAWLTAAGGVVKIMSLLAAIVVAMQGAITEKGEPFSGIVLGVIVGLVGLALGALAVALGQVIHCLADAAIHTSPILTLDEKREALENQGR